MRRLGLAALLLLALSAGNIDNPGVNPQQMMHSGIQNPLPSGPVVSCGALQADFTIACDAALVSLGVP